MEQMNYKNPKLTQYLHIVWFEVLNEFSDSDLPWQYSDWSSGQVFSESSINGFSASIASTLNWFPLSSDAKLFDC